MLLSNQNVSAVSVKGVDVGNKIFSAEMMTYDDENVTELLFDDDARLPGIVISVESASTLGATVGDNVNVIPPMFTMTPFGMIPKMKPFRVVGIFRQSGGFFEIYYAYVSLLMHRLFWIWRGRLQVLRLKRLHLN